MRDPVKLQTKYARYDQSPKGRARKARYQGGQKWDATLRRWLRAPNTERPWLDNGTARTMHRDLAYAGVRAAEAGMRLAEQTCDECGAPLPDEDPGWRCGRGRADGLS